MKLARYSYKRSPCCTALPLCLAIALFPALLRAKEWTHCADIPDHRGNLYFSAPWSPDTGATFRLAQSDSDRAAVVAIRRDEIALTPTPRARDAADKNTLRLRSHPERLPATPSDRVEWTLTIRERTWTLYAEDRPVLTFPPPFNPPAALYLPAAPEEPKPAPRPRFQRTAPFMFEDNFFLPGDTEDTLIEWEQVSGAWQLRTAADATTERGERLRRRRGRKPDPERSANFSSLRGQGQPALILAGHDFYDRYTAETALITAPGEAGLAFYHTDAGAYHALTLAMDESSHVALLRLWRTSGETNAPRETLAAVATELTHDQWVRLRAEICTHRIRAYLDHTLVMDLPAEDMPAGGRFGLYAHGKTGMLFDDVRARTHLDLSLNTLDEIRWHKLAGQGDFFPRRRRFARAPDPDPDISVLDTTRARQDQWLVLGETNHPGHVFSAEFNEITEQGTIGLIAGFRHAQAPHWLFSRTLTDNEELFLLRETGRDTDAVLAELRLPASQTNLTKPVSLMADATAPDELRLYRNGALVLVHSLETPLRGASGLHVGAGTAARIARLRYRFERDDLHRDQFEKNRVFREDPFMRNWASPEGEWAQDAQGLTWHKGDFYGRFHCRMPFVEGSAIHVSVPENGTNGLLAVTARAGKLRLEQPAESDPALRVLAQVPAKDFARDTDEKSKRQTPWFALHYEDHWLWATSGDRLLFRQALAEPLTGRRMRIEGFSVNDLRHSHVERYQVKDHLFNESLHEWTQNGGEWSVVNRFQCDPRWSHMNGEAPDGLAALWSKYDFEGDFCLEMYAGMRHRFYTRAGDLNLTVMSAARTPGFGYTVTCTGWDPDHSQLYTRLYRHGALLEETDAYLVPRHREGQRRRILDPVIQRGRDLHGAWYYLKLRRVGDRLEFHFDNELVFSVQDEEPIPVGGFGIWTFMNSMMVARVKMAAERIVPRPHAFAIVPPHTTLDDLVRREQPFDSARHRTLIAHGLPAERLLPESWTADDPTGRLLLQWPEPADGERPRFVATTTLGAGEMLARASLPPVPYADLAGWSFQVQRTARAQFNFHYSIGRMNSKGQYEPAARFFHRLSGTDFSKGAYRKTGSTPIPGTAEPGKHWHDGAPWTDVRVWLPMEHETGLGSTDNLFVRIEGFGNLQPSYVMQGLHGNGPGEAYAVRGLTEIRTRAPTLGLLSPDTTLSMKTGPDAEPGPIGTFTNIVDAQTAVNSLTNNGLVQIAIEAREPDSAAVRHDLSWIRAPDAPSIAAAWHPDIPNAIRLTQKDTDWPDRRFHAARVRIGDQQTETWREGLTSRIAFVPRRQELTAERTPAVPVALVGDGLSADFSLPWSDNPSREPPTLLCVGDAIPFFENFEARVIPAYLRSERPRADLRHLDPEQGSFLRIANTGQQQRLRAVFPHQANLAQAPLLQFRYRAEPMARITLSLHNNHAVKLNEEFGPAREVRHGNELVADGAWHTWTGMISDAVGVGPLRRTALATQALTFGSRLSIDQTGLFTEWDIGHLVQGPAVSAHRPLAVTPDYFDFHGVASVAMALYDGTEPPEQLDADALAALDWREIPNRQKTVADLSGLSDGPHRLLLRAKNRHGHASAVTAIPFLHAPRPPSVSHRLARSDEPLHNESVLRIEINTGNGAPVNLEDLQLKWNDDTVRAAALGSRYEHSPEKAILLLNWPYIFRDQIQQTRDGERFTLTLASIHDGAGNRAEDAIVAMTMDYSRDKTPPTLLRTEWPANILWNTGWESAVNNDRHFRSRQSLAIKHEPGQEPWLEHVSKGRQSAFWMQFQRPRVWRPARHPFLAFQIRRPAIPARDNTAIVLTLECHGKRTYHIPLSGKPKRNEPVLAMPEPIEWKPGAWHPVTLDLHALLSPLMSGREWNSLRVHRLRFSVETGPRPETTCLRSVFVFSAWGPEHEVKVNAFDASGIAETLWRIEDAAPTMTFAPAGMDQTLNRWATAQVRDRAGNLSFPWHIPLGRAQPAEPDASGPDDEES